MAHKKGQSSTRNGRDSNPKYRGLKRQHGQSVTPGSIIVRQVGSKFYAGLNVGTGKDYTLYSLISGTVQFATTAKKRKLVKVLPAKA